MKKLFVAALSAIMVLGAAGVAQAGHEGGGPGPNGHNEKGLCTAYFNGQKKGHEKNGNPPPFAALVEEAGDGSDDNDTAGDPADVKEYCESVASIGGNPENGRFPDEF